MNNNFLSKTEGKLPECLQQTLALICCYLKGEGMYITEKIMQKHLSLLQIPRTGKQDNRLNKRFFDNGIFYSVADVASMVGCSTRTIERCITKGELKATKVGRKKLIRKEWVESWLQP